MKTLLFWLLFIGYTGIACSQTLTLTDRKTREPIELATLMSENPRVYTSTNSLGQADISAFINANAIEIRSLGYKRIIISYQKLQALNFALEMEPSYLQLDAVVISGTKWRQNSTTIPSKIVTISPREVALQNPQTTADLLSLSGKVYIQKSQQGGGSPMIRGFATHRLLYVVDGVRMNTAIFRGGNLQNVISLDPFAMESTEVLFGPGSVIYGSDAIGGVMSFQTLTPQLSLDETPRVKGRAVTRYSSTNKEKTAHFDVGVGWKKWAVLTSFSAFDFDHLRQGSHGPDDYLKKYYVQRISNIDQIITQSDPLLQIPSAYSQMNMMQKIRFKPNEAWDFIYGFHYSETSEYGRYDRHLRTRNGTARYGEWNYGPQKWMMNNFNMTHTGNTLFYDRMSIRIAWQAFEESRIDRALNQDERAIRIEEVDAGSTNIDIVKSLGEKNKIFYGLEYVLNAVTSTGKDEDIVTGITQAGASRYPLSTWNSAGIYINDEHQISDKISLQAGLRYSYFLLEAQFDTTFYPFPYTEAKLNHGALTGSFGGVYRPSETWVVNANFGTAFRSPNVDDMGKVFDSEQGIVVVPNPDLESEYAINFDFGIAKIFSNTIKIDIAAYYTQLNNALVRRDFTLNGADSILYDGVMSKVQAIQNAAKANVYGVQAGVEIKLPEGFSFSTDLNYQTGKEELDDGMISPSRHAPPLFGTSRLAYTANKVNLQFYACYQQKRDYEDLAFEEQGKDEIYAKDENGNNYSPAWLTLNIKAMVPVTDQITLSSGIENITDRRYRPYSSGISAPGRNFFLTLKATF
ncbi:MAG: TonB-dependent receptor [Bacteroidales bacterium]|nr:TonB-dependent receptor [Bacteroidales bacterium]MDD2323304.1 TonB-dependent receptor [Bacteroidales bacterium]MDD3011196.1 TonB-dependent receptor [Bacteroidales bacterium]MDD3961443.1 TonB-dependent receptor [Bacteroidales bacterium]MDY0285883.1 TonB-dependent receptor [Bacteroidales bacterium]